MLPANEYPPFTLEPGKEALDQPAAFIQPEVTTILVLQFPCGAMQGNQLHAVLSEVVVESFAVMSPVTNEILGFGLEHLEVKTELHQGDFMMIHRMRADREGQPLPIHNREDFHAFAAFRKPDSLAAILGCCKRGIDEAFPFINSALFAQRICQVRQDLPQDLALTPLLESAMDSFAVGIALGEEMPLGTSVQNLEHGVQDSPTRDWFAARACVRDVFFRKMFSNPFPLVIAQPEHEGTYGNEHSPRQLF